MSARRRSRSVPRQRSTGSSSFTFLSHTLRYAPPVARAPFAEPPEAAESPKTRPRRSGSLDRHRRKTHKGRSRSPKSKKSKASKSTGVASAATRSRLKYGVRKRTPAKSASEGRPKEAWK